MFKKWPPEVLYEKKGLKSFEKIKEKHGVSIF